MKADLSDSMWFVAPESATRRDMRLRLNAVNGVIECTGGLLRRACTFLGRHTLRMLQGSSCVVCDVDLDMEEDVGTC
jgi:hypothetical protein